MPWIEETKVEQRLKFVTRVRRENISVAKACRVFGISRPTGYKWLNRYDEQGLEGLKDRSRAPESIPHKTDEKLEEQICALRQRYPSFGPKKLRAWLRREHPEADWPAASTIGDILSRNELIEEKKTTQKTPPRTQPLAEADAPNRIWSTDFKGQFELGDGQMCYPLTITDNFSRMILGCYALPSTKGEPVKECFEEVFSTWGLPRAIRSDNGAPFASRAPAGLSHLSAWWLALGIEHERTDPASPQQNGRHERMHLTLKQQTARPAESDMEAQQERFDDFVTFFNDLRPHEALGQTAPCTHHEPSERCYPTDVEPVSYPKCDLERCVQGSGYIRFANQEIYVSQALRGRRVGLVEVDVNVWVVTYAGTDLGIFEPGEATMAPLAKNDSVARSTL